jgi:High potential iron-sulfur protein
MLSLRRDLLQCFLDGPPEAAKLFHNQEAVMAPLIFDTQEKTRRMFLLTLAASGGLLSTRVQAQAMVDEKDVLALSLGYVAEAKNADTKKYPKFAATQNCGGCALFQGKASDKAGGCPLFAGKQVVVTGWCSAWAKKGG